ncbi:MAG: cob(I)yrinic acid a,c-diamide adenosyltransferase [Bacteroidales bacterium]|nr:cob(I)yrinic acid a,c-diamide adenosyltransferase [Bacteroidales bacterium]
MVYTKTGDNGTTSLVGGSRVDKDNVRVEAYGTADELNSHIGLLAEMIKQEAPDHYTQLKRIQHNLFIVQTLLATEDESLCTKLPQLHPNETPLLEQQIDLLVSTLPHINRFVIAGGNMAAAQAHVCRTVCRRTERRVITLARTNLIETHLIQYLNRLSDYLFVLSRHLVMIHHDEEDLFEPPIA